MYSIAGFLLRESASSIILHYRLGLYEQPAAPIRWLHDMETLPPPPPPPPLCGGTMHVDNCGLS